MRRWWWQRWTVWMPEGEGQGARAGGSARTVEARRATRVGGKKRKGCFGHGRREEKSSFTVNIKLVCVIG